MARDNLTHEEYINRIYAEINEMIENNKIPIAKKMIIEQLTRFPNSGILKNQFATCLIKEKNYEQAIKVLNEAPTEKVFLRLASIYIKLGYEEELLDLYQKYYQNPIAKYRKVVDEDSECYHLIGMYLQNKFNLEDQLNLQIPDHYTQSQVNCYNAQTAIDLIETNYSQGRKNQKEQYFTDKIDIEVLYNKIKKYIDLHPEQGSIYKTFYERYEFYYPQCGETKDGEILNAFVVFTIVGSSNILSMMPVKLNKDLAIYSFEELVEKDNIIKETPALRKSRKPKTGLERFNQRYGNGNNK